MKHIQFNLFLCAALLSGPAANTLADGGSVDYPSGYRDWTHVKSMVIQQGHGLYDAFGGIHHIYANAKALKGYEDGHFPDGSVIVFDLLKAPYDESAITEGERKVLGVMQKDSRAFSATGGWGYEGFAGGDEAQRVVGTNAAAACYQCHTAKQSSDYVFSTWRE